MPKPFVHQDTLCETLLLSGLTHVSVRPMAKREGGLYPRSGRGAEWDVLMQCRGPLYPRILTLSGFVCSSCQGPRPSLVRTGLESLKLQSNGPRC